ncbi:MAG: hypothetical protein KDA32_00730 [Phycisphaerales bacterium]|nr:hypothetical protein [Phycisphaerales bacterium]
MKTTRAVAIGVSMAAWGFSASHVWAGPGGQPTCAPSAQSGVDSIPYLPPTTYYDLANGCVLVDQLEPAGAQPVEVTLLPPITNAGVVELNWTTRITATDLRPYLLDQFDRATPAFWGLGQGMAWFDIDTPRVRSLASVSASDGVFMSGGGVGGKTPVPQCGNQHYMFGLVDGWLHRSSDGVTWELLGFQPSTVLKALHDGTLLSLRTVTGSGPQIFRSVDDGVTWTRSVWAGSGIPFAFYSTTATIVNWGVHQAANGTIIVVEYGLPAEGRFIYRSTDNGASWSAVHDAGFDVIHHYHAVTKQEALGRWVAITGDNRGTPRNFIKVSDNDGLTWYDWTAPLELWLQPTYLLDFGDPTRLLFGSDTSWQVGVLDVSDGPTSKTVSSVLTNWDRRPNRHTCFFMFEHNGLYYACHRIAEYGDRYPVISVSANLRDWAVYHRFDAQEVAGLEFAGEWGGRLHLGVLGNSTWKHLSISPAKLSQRTGVVVTPATENLMSLADSKLDSVTNWVNGSPLDAQGGRGSFWDGAPGMQGDGCLRYQRSDGQRMLLRSPSVPYTPGKAYQARVWMRGDGGLVQMRWSVDTTGAGESVWGQLSNTEWQEFVTPPITMPTGVGVLRLEVVVFANTGTGCDVWLDNMTVSEAPAVSWTLGGTSDGDHMSTWQMVGDAWTNVLSIQTDDMADFYQGHNPFVVKTWGAAEPNDMRLVYVPIDKRFELQRFRDGQLIGDIRLAAKPFQRNAEIRFVIRSNAERTALSVSNGNNLRTRCGRPDARYRNRALMMRYGDGADKTLPMTLIDDHLYEGWLPESDLGPLLRDPNAAADSWQPDGYCVERRAPGGDWVLIGEITDGSTSFFDEDPIDGATYRVTAKGPFGGSRPSNEKATGLRSDINGDGEVGIADLAVLIASFGKCEGEPGYEAQSDLTGDDCVGLEDLSLLLGDFGKAIEG